MANLTRYEPFREMINDFFERGFVFPRGAGLDSPAFDIRDEKDTVFVDASLPGFEEKDIDIQIDGNLLTVRAEKDDEREEHNGDTWYLHERRFGRVQRTVQLPVSVDGSKAEAGLSKGVLTIKLPKTKESIGHKIAVTSKKLLSSK